MRWDKRKRKNFSRKVDNKTLLKFTQEFHFISKDRKQKIKRNFLILIQLTAQGSELGWVRFAQTEPELSGQLNPMIKGFVNIRRKFAFRNHNSCSAVSRQVADNLYCRQVSDVTILEFQVLSFFASGLMCQNGLWKFPPPGRSFWITVTS